MLIFLYILLFIISFLLMEFVAHFTHKYIMHGILWNLHKDHHVSKNALEHNDWFSLIFAIPSFVCIYFGLKYNYTSTAIIGFAMATYGGVYFIVHDVFIHQRIKILRNSNNTYLKALRRAHKIHHKFTEKENGESFGFLIVGKKYFKNKSTSLFKN